VVLLSKRHVPRLTSWVDALLTSDSMTDSKALDTFSSKTLSSLVLLPSSVRKRRGVVLQMLMGLKKEVARTLTSAARLGIDGKAVSIAPSSATTATATDGNDKVKEDLIISSNTSATATTRNEAPCQSWQDGLGINSSYNGSVKDRIYCNGANAKNNGKSKLQIKLRKS